MAGAIDKKIEGKEEKGEQSAEIERDERKKKRRKQMKSINSRFRLVNSRERAIIGHGRK